MPNYGITRTEEIISLLLPVINKQSSTSSAKQLMTYHCSFADNSFVSLYRVSIVNYADGRRAHSKVYKYSVIVIIIDILPNVTFSCI